MKDIEGNKMIYILILVFIFLGLYSLSQIIFREPLTKIKSKITLKSYIGKYIHISQYKKKLIQEKLNKAGLDESSEEYLAGYILIAVPCLIYFFFINSRGFTLVSIVSIMILAIFSYDRYDKIRRLINEKREAIIEDLPEFMSYMTNSLRMSRDITSIVQNYIDAANSQFKRELERLLVDLKTANVDRALHNFEIRISITSLSNYISVVRATLEGEAQISTLEAITNDMSIIEREIAKKKSHRIPKRVSRASFAVGAAAIVYLISIFAYAAYLQVNIIVK